MQELQKDSYVFINESREIRGDKCSAVCNKFLYRLFKTRLNHVQQRSYNDFVFREVIIDADDINRNVQTIKCVEIMLDFTEIAD